MTSKAEMTSQSTMEQKKPLATSSHAGNKAPIAEPYLPLDGFGTLIPNRVTEQEQEQNYTFSFHLPENVRETVGQTKECKTVNYSMPSTKKPAPSNPFQSDVPKLPAPPAAQKKQVQAERPTTLNIRAKQGDLVRFTSPKGYSTVYRVTTNDGQAPQAKAISDEPPATPITEPAGPMFPTQGAPPPAQTPITQPVAPKFPAQVKASASEMKPCVSETGPPETILPTTEIKKPTQAGGKHASEGGETPVIKKPMFKAEYTIRELEGPHTLVLNTTDQKTREVEISTQTAQIGEWHND